MLERSFAFGRGASGAAAREETSPLLPCEVSGLCFRAGGNRLIDGIDLKLTAGPTKRTLPLGGYH